jgi:AraC-like DNA-binding protein
MRPLPDGGYSICDTIEIDGEGTSHFAFGRGWLVEVLDVTGGEYYFISDGRKVQPAARRFGIFYPRFTLVRAGVKDIRGKVQGFGSVRQPDALPETPFMFETDFGGEFTSIDEAVNVLRESRNRLSIEINTHPSIISLKARRLIDENFQLDPSIARIAARLRVSHEHLSRRFKRDYGLSPSAYLHQLRVAEATFLLSLGQEIVDISMDVGYNDLSRFYKQFRKQHGTSPARCRTTKL